MSRVIVVGAGVGGLAVGARLAARGHEVTVLEAADRVGGKLGTAELAGGFRFDTGPSLLTLPQVFRELFADTGDPLDLPLRPLDPAIDHRFADGSAVCTVRAVSEQVARFDDAFGAGTGAAWRRMVHRGGKAWRASERAVLRREPSLSGLLAGSRHPGDVRALAPGRSLHELGAAMLPDPRQRMMLDRYATYVGSDPRRTPAALAMIPFLEHEFGCWYVEGGLSRIATTLHERLIACGGRVRLGTRVERIEHAGGRVTGVRLAEGLRLRADVVVSDADADVTDTDLLGRPARGRADSLSGFVLLLALRGRTPGLAHHTVLFGEQPYEQEFDAVFGGRPVEDPVIYLNVPDDPALRPDGHEGWFVLVNAPQQGPFDWDRPDVTEGYAGRLVDLLAARGHDVRSRLMLADAVSPAELGRRTLAPGGAIYGRAFAGWRSLAGRPGNRGPVRGLFRVGGSTHPGGGLPMVTLSARIVSELVGGA